MRGRLKTVLFFLSLSLYDSYSGANKCTINPKFEEMNMSELMEIKKKFSLEELSELTGISRRTIRFYIQKGLMNGPEGEKRGAYYTTEHLEDLLRIKRMTEKHIPLNEIRKADTEDEKPALPVGSVTVCSHICLGAGLTLVVDHKSSELSGEKFKEFAAALCGFIEEFKNKEHENV